MSGSRRTARAGACAATSPRPPPNGTVGRDQGELYRGARLAAALDWSTDHALELNELERAFVAESREASEKETKRVVKTNRRLRGLLVGAARPACRRHRRRHLRGRPARRGPRRSRRGADAETAQLAQRLGAQALVEEDLDRSLLLARQAVAIDDTAQTRSTLLASLRRSPAAIGIINVGEGDYVRAIAVSPDGRTLAVGGLGAAGLRFFDATTYEQLGEPVPVPVTPELDLAHVEGLAYSPDGGTLAFGGRPGYLRLVDTESRELLAETEH